MPGDIYEISDPHLTIFPCDALLLTGDAIVNESMLTGESVPVSKLPCTRNEILHLLSLTTTISPELAKHFLFSGTKIVRVRRTAGAAIAMVVRTGFNTTKGSLVRSMLFPRPNKFKFYRDSFRFIGVMAIIAALGFCVSIVNFIELGMHFRFIIIRALDLITIIVPPALPATLTIGTSFALSRLRKKEIFCISPNRVNVAGTVDIMCFDKTGTLTEEGLDVLGARARIGDQFSELITENSKLSDSILYTMATCHSLKLVGEMIGDPLDAKMFEFTGWTFEEGGRVYEVKDGRYTVRDGGSSKPRVRSPSGEDLEVLRIFEFESAKRRMSVIVRKGKDLKVYVKGAPEIMRDVCRQSIEGYEEMLEYYTHHGYRVIALATKSLKVSRRKAEKIKREDVESDLEFLGFIVFENKLKPSTSGVLEKLRHARIRGVMCTGDNILTAISVAKECQLVEGYVFVPHFEGTAEMQDSELTWTCVEDPGLTLNPYSLLPNPNQEFTPDNYTIQYALAVSGEVFRWIIDFAPMDILEKVHC